MRLSSKYVQINIQVETSVFFYPQLKLGSKWIVRSVRPRDARGRSVRARMVKTRPLPSAVPVCFEVVAFATLPRYLHKYFDGSRLGAFSSDMDALLRSRFPAI